MLFKLIRAGAGLGLVGAETIDVLAIEPRAIAKPDSVDFGDWALAAIVVMYVCECDGVLMQIASRDLWADIEAGIYERVGP